MIKTKKIVFLSLCVFIFMFFCFSSPIESVKAISTSAKSYCVIDVESGEILASENENINLPMASTTKILTAIVVIENADLSSTICVDKKAVGVEGSSIYLKDGEKIKIIDLLYGLMLRSGNDSAVALAIAVAGSEENFAKMMNDKAREIGAENSLFKNPHGLDAEGHYTTALDLAKISAYAMKNPIFKQIVSSKMHVVPATDKSEERYFKNKNKMLFSYDGACGVKTGYTKKTGRCLVSAAQKDGKTLVCVVLSCPNMWQDSKNLLDFCFEKSNK